VSLRKSSSTPSPAALPVAPEYLRRFIVDAHVIVAEGYSRLNPAVLVAEDEPAISGLIVGKSRSWLSDPDCPEWTKSYFITEEKHEDDSAQKGMARPRIDVHVESSERRPRPHFVFEAKRLYRSDSVAEYVGKKGLGALCDGTYAGNASAAGMLGYVQAGPVAVSVQKVRAKLEGDRGAHGLAAGAVWTEQETDSRIGPTLKSTHARAGRPPIDVYHSFLKCCG
jgi:hypothetical protein